MTQPKKKQEPSAFQKILEKADVAPPKTKKKDDIPELRNIPDVVKTSVDTYEQAKVSYTQAKATMDVHGDTIRDFVADLQDKEGFEGNYHNSYRLYGNEGKVTVSASERYSINIEDEEELQAIAGSKFSQLFQKEYTIQLRQEVFQDEKLQHELTSLLGDKFNTFLEISAKITVIPGFKQKVYQLLKPKQLDRLRVFVTQSKLSIK